jgi:hypothetical protein
MTEEKNLSFTINENDVSKNTFEIKIIVDDNRILNRTEIINFNINNYCDKWSAEDRVCLCRFFLIMMFVTVFLIIYEVNNNNR